MGELAKSASYRSLTSLTTAERTAGPTCRLFLLSLRVRFGSERCCCGRWKRAILNFCRIEAAIIITLRCIALVTELPPQ